MLLKLLFIEELDLDFCADFAVTSVDFMNDTKGRLFCTIHTFSVSGKWMRSYRLRKLT
jgi:hypothetical protein